MNTVCNQKFLKTLIDNLENGNSCPTLDLSGFTIDHASASKIVKYIPLCSLRILIFKEINLLDDIYAQIILSACDSPTITALEIIDTKLSKTVIISIIKLISTNKLTHLDMSVIKKKSMIKIIEAVSNCHSIRHISITSCNMDEEFAPWIIKTILSNDNLNYLNILYNPFGNSLYEIGEALTFSNSILDFSTTLTLSQLEIYDKFIDQLKNNYTLLKCTIMTCYHQDIFLQSVIDKILERNLNLIYQKRFRNTKCIFTDC